MVLVVLPFWPLRPLPPTQSLLRHFRIQTTLDLYTLEDGDESQAAQGEYLKAMGLTSTRVPMNVEWIWERMLPAFWL